MHNRNIKKYILYSAFFLLALFILLIFYITYLQTVKSDALANHPLNRRAAEIEEHVQRGMILDATGRKIAYTEKTADGFRRRYPLAAVTAPVTGYVGKTIGNAGIEGYANGDLVGITDSWHKFGPISQLFASDKGNNVQLTVDASVQKAAYAALGNRRGAVVVLDSRTGAVLAMVSRPSFDPNTIEENWDHLQNAADSALLNRAAQGLYPPGSILKTMITDAALKENVTDSSEIFECPGYLKVGSNYTLYESHHEVHGKVDLKEALTVSCNVTFGTLALRLGADKLENTFDRFGFKKKLDNEIGEAPIQLPNFKQLSDGEISQVGIGQSTVLVTPLRMAMLAAAFDNHGVIMQPYIIDKIISPNGVIIKKSQAQKWLEVTTADRAQLIKGYMKNVVMAGTGRSAAVSGIDVIGKTGTAENSGGEDHAWFIGAAALPQRDIAFAIVVENSGGGGTEAAPIARQIIKNILDNEEVSP